MKQNSFNVPYRLSIVIAVLAFAASAGGLFMHDLYRDNVLITAAWRGNDLVTLALATPLLIGALIFARRGSLRGQLIWLAMLGYMLYNYIFYLYGAAFNQFFLLYVALFTLAIYALIFSLTRIDTGAMNRIVQGKMPVNWIGGFMLFFAIMLGGMELVRTLSFLSTGQVPPDIVRTGHPTGVVYATDLSLLVPSMLMGAIWLWQRKPWGYVVAVIVNVKATTYVLALIAMSIFAAKTTGTNDPLVPFYALLGAGNLMSSVLLLRKAGSVKK